jgi:hypothetical protein
MMKNRPASLLKWFLALCLLGPAGSCATSEPVDQGGTGGSSATGGTTGTGGGTSTGGNSATGGNGTGGATGGNQGTGGVISSTGGQPGTGGLLGTGGGAAGGHAGSAGGHAGTGTGNGGRGGGAGGRTGGSGGSGGASASATFAFVDSIITANCVGSKCHDGSQSVKFVSTTASTLYANLTSMKAPDCMNLPLVTPGDPTMSALYLAITQMCGSKVGRMPDGKPALPTATIQAIQTWITNGAPQS